MQNPIVIDVSQQPPVTPEITYAEVIVGAIGVAGAIMLLAALAGLITGVIIIYVKRRAEAARTSTESERVVLGL